jgi:hypothetical protein
MNKKTYKFKSDKTINELSSSPVLYFLSDGDYKVEKCGVLKAFKLIKSHLNTISKLWVSSNV